jgi:hypothetical protein
MALVVSFELYPRVVFPQTTTSNPIRQGYYSEFIENRSVADRGTWRSHLWEAGRITSCIEWVQC